MDPYEWPRLGKFDEDGKLWVDEYELPQLLGMNLPHFTGGALLAEKEIAAEMAPLIPSGVEVIAGLEMGGIPIVTMLSQITNLPASFIRKEAKEYGTCKYAEGAGLLHKKVVLIEDVVSSGGAKCTCVVRPSLLTCLRRSFSAGPLPDMVK